MFPLYDHNYKPCSITHTLIHLLGMEDNLGNCSTKPKITEVFHKTFIIWSLKFLQALVEKLAVS